MHSKTYNLTLEQAETVRELDGEIGNREFHTIYGRDELGRFKVSFAGNADLTELTVEQPVVVLFFKGDNGEDVYLKTTAKCSFERAWEGIQTFLLEYLHTGLPNSTKYKGD